MPSKILILLINPPRLLRDYWQPMGHLSQLMLAMPHLLLVASILAWCGIYHITYQSHFCLGMHCVSLLCYHKGLWPWLTPVSAYLLWSAHAGLVLLRIPAKARRRGRPC